MREDAAEGRGRGGGGLEAEEEPTVGVWTDAERGENHMIALRGGCSSILQQGMHDPLEVQQ
jgi:hypothetical protein